MLINYNNVNVTHNDGVTALSEIKFQVNDGEFIYVIGKVGSGKSSLLRSIYGELSVSNADEAKVLGRDMTRVKRSEIQALRREIGIIFQDFKLLHDHTVYGNLSFVLEATGLKNKEQRRQRIEEVLKAVSMEGTENKFPYELSGGEQQRIAIARSLLNRPKVILADEPTGNLDPETAENIVGLFRDIASTGSAVVITTHNMQIMDRYPGIVYECEDGHLKVRS